MHNEIALLDSYRKELLPLWLDEPEAALSDVLEQLFGPNREGDFVGI